MRIQMTPEQEKLLQKIANANEREIYKAFLIQAQKKPLICREPTSLTKRWRSPRVQSATRPTLLSGFALRTRVGARADYERAGCGRSDKRRYFTANNS